MHSSSTIPLDDPTLLFANAGMNQAIQLTRPSFEQSDDNFSCFWSFAGFQPFFSFVVQAGFYWNSGSQQRHGQMDPVSSVSTFKLYTVPVDSTFCSKVCHVVLKGALHIYGTHTSIPWSGIPFVYEIRTRYNLRNM